MANQRITRVNELLRREISSVLYRVMQDVEDMDLAALTVTDVDTAPNLRHAEVYVSVLGTPEQASRMVSRLNGRRKEIQNEVVKNVVLKYTPRLHFRHTGALASGDRVLELLKDLDVEDVDPDWEPEPEED